MVLSPGEAVQLFHLPLAGVPMDSARVRVMPRRPSLVAGEGSVLCRLDDDRRAAVKISQTDRRHHMHAVGPTGAGKSTLLLNLALQDIEAGIGIGIIDPKGDLIRDLLERIPTQHAKSRHPARSFDARAPCRAQRPRVRRPESARARNRRRGDDLSQELRALLGAAD
jgi:DNA helicase HerA-like ATPase